MKLSLTLSILLILFAGGVFAEEKGLICTHIKENDWAMAWGMDKDVRFYIDISNLRVRHFTDLYPKTSTIERPCFNARNKCTRVLQTDIELVVTERDYNHSLVWNLREDDKAGAHANARTVELNRETLELEVNPWKYGFTSSLDRQKYACRFSAENEIEDLVRKENERQIQYLEASVKENEKIYRESKEKRKL